MNNPGLIRASLMAGALAAGVPGGATPVPVVGLVGAVASGTPGVTWRRRSGSCVTKKVTIILPSVSLHAIYRRTTLPQCSICCTALLQF